MNEKTIKCEMLDNFGKWNKAIINSTQFKFLSNYDGILKESKVEIWKGYNGDWYILRNVVPLNDKPYNLLPGLKRVSRGNKGIFSGLTKTQAKEVERLTFPAQKEYLSLRKRGEDHYYALEIASNYI